MLNIREYNFIDMKKKKLNKTRIFIIREYNFISGPCFFMTRNKLRTNFLFDLFRIRFSQIHHLYIYSTQRQCTSDRLYIWDISPCYNARHACTLLLSYQARGILRISTLIHLQIFISNTRVPLLYLCILLLFQSQKVYKRHIKESERDRERIQKLASLRREQNSSLYACICMKEFRLNFHYRETRARVLFSLCIADEN